jgi:hypothetical protein
MSDTADESAPCPSIAIPRNFKGTTLSLCEDCGWVCETHPGRPWEGDHACDCGGAGAPCPWCNLPDKDGTPRLPDGFKTEFDDRGWRH